MTTAPQMIPEHRHLFNQTPRDFESATGCQVCGLELCATLLFDGRICNLPLGHVEDCDNTWFPERRAG
jgi:hypothetical protein